jgi:hypothetical protein
LGNLGNNWAIIENDVFIKTGTNKDAKYEINNVGYVG